ncbi:hypothetical protein ACSBL2_22220 [Pedobacter sp. AW31-3R]|uniref:hypothetical protein n=1 Tax=Pedobacter sp. AW31-3R TaxID=3445781 RepID=UPI003F9F14D5
MPERKLPKFIHLYIALLLCIAFIVSVVLYPKISLSVPSYVMIYLFAPVFFAASYLKDRLLLKELFFIAGVFVLMNLLAQAQVYFFSVTFTDTLTLVDKANPDKVLLRTTLISQSIYLFAGILCYLYLKYYATSAHLKYLYIGLRIIVVLGFLEIILFQLTGVNGDLMTNRVFNGKEGSGSLFQTITLGGLRMQRMKSLTGEPSMFAFSLIPFWILCIPLKRYADFIFFGIALLFTFSTSAYLGIIILIIGACVADRRIAKPMLWVVPIGLVVVVALFFVSPAIHKLVHSVFIDKFSGTNQSGSERSGYFLGQFNFWKDQLNLAGKLVGVGFGYVRSTDFFSTLLVNNGLLGLTVFTVFFFRHAFVKVQNIQFNKFYVIALFAAFMILMCSVPEFAYLSLWILLSLPYWVERKSLV